jgi:hypothetical protein
LNRETWRGKKPSEMTSSERVDHDRAVEQWVANNKRRRIAKHDPEAIARSADEVRRLFRR